MTEQDKFSGSASRNLTAEFASDGTARACDKYALAFESLPHFFIVHADMVAAQEVGDVHFAQTVDADLAAEQFVNPRHGARRDSFLAAGVIDQANDIPRRGGNGDDDFVHLLVVENVCKFVYFANDRDAINLVILFGRVIIEKANRE